MTHPLLITLTLALLAATGHARQDSLRATRHAVSAVTFGAGHANVFDTYLSPMEYEGPEARIMFEKMRMTRIMGGNVSIQNILQLYGSFTKNPSRSGDMYSGMISWECALHHQFRVSPHLKLLAGPVMALNIGGIYNKRNSNNPAQAKAYASLGASAAAIGKWRIRNYPLTLRYQINIPLAGLAFSPEFGESYYEIFSLGNGGRNILFTSPHNAPTFRQMLTLDFPIRQTIMRVGYVCDIQQAKLNNLKHHFYSHNFMIGFVRNFHILKKKNTVSLPSHLTPF